VDDTLQHNLAALLEASKKVLSAHSPPLTLSIATYSDAGTIQRLTNLRLIHPYVDHVIMMAYDYHRRISPQAGPNSPLYGKADGKWESDILSDLKGYTDQLPSEKILLGIPFYGYQWQIEDASNPNAFTTPKTGSTMTYEYIPALLEQGLHRSFDPLAYSPFILFNKNGKAMVLYYDDAQSLRYKFQLVKQARLGGIAIWALGYEGRRQELWDTLQNELLSK
jgi:spore germination protein YaaH